MPGFGTWNRTLRSELSICSSFLYSRSAPRLCEHRPSPTASSRSGLPNATFSGITSVTVAAVAARPSIPCASNAASCASVKVPAGTVGSNSPWIMLCAR